MRRGAHRLVVWFGALAATLILVAGAGLWRLTQGPVDLDQLTPLVQQALGRSLGGVKIAISGGHFGVDPGSQALNLWLEGVRLSRDDGEPVATFPVVAASFSLSALLRGKMAPTRLAVQRPVLRFVRDENGKLRFGLGEVDTEPAAVSDLDQLAGPARPDQPFGLMRRVTVRDATLVLDDRQTGRRWQADRVDATAERTPEGLAGDLSMAVAVAERRPEFHAAYRYSHSDGKLDLVGEIGAIEPAKLASLAPELQALEMAQFPISGSLATRLDLAGGSTEGVRIDLRFGKGSIKSDLLPEGQLNLEQGSLHAVYAPESSQLRLAKLELDLGSGSVFTVKGKIDDVTPALIAGNDRGSSPISGELGLTLSDVPIQKLESLWPPALSRNGRRWVVANIHDGVLDEAAVRLDLEVDPTQRSAEIVSAHGSMRYHDATISYFRDLPPARKVGGTATLNDKRLVFTPTAGAVKSVQLTGGTLQITDLGAPVEWLSVDLALAGPIQDILEVIDTKPLRYAHDIGVDPALVGGRSEGAVHFQLPLLNDVKLSQVKFSAKASLTGAALADAAMHRNLTDGTFALEIDGSGAHLHGNSRFDGVPLYLDANLFFKPKSGARARYRVNLALNDEQRRRLAFDFFPDRVAGPVRVDATYWAMGGAHAEAELGIDLRAAKLSIVEAGWKKPAGDSARARLIVDLHNDQITKMSDIEIKAAGFDGRFAVALAPGSGRLESVEIQRLALGQDNLSGLVSRRRQGGWRVDVRGSDLDLSHWIKDLGNGAGAQQTEDSPLEIDAHFARVSLGPRREVHDFRAQLLRDGVDLPVGQIDARFPNGRQLSLRSGTNAGKPSLTLRSDDLGSTLRLFDVTDNVIGGGVTIAGQVAEVGGKHVLSGRIDGEDYSLVRAPAFARILALPSFTGAGSLLAGSGIPFSTLRGEFAYADAHLALQNLLAYGEALGVSANGAVDLGRDRLDLQGTIVPAYALNSILGNVPVIGSLLLGGEGQGLFAANYRVTGSAADPQVAVNPLSALAPGFLRRLFQPNFGIAPPVQQSLEAQ
jgi:hypothetical protein